MESFIITSLDALYLVSKQNHRYIFILVIINTYFSTNCHVTDACHRRRLRDIIISKTECIYNTMNNRCSGIPNCSKIKVYMKNVYYKYRVSDSST